MRDPFARAAKSVLSLLGQGAFLNGTPAGNVNVEHGVEVYEKNAEGESMFSRSVATIEKMRGPRRGDTLELVDADGNVTATYRVETMIGDTGYTVRHIVTKI